MVQFPLDPLNFQSSSHSMLSLSSVARDEITRAQDFSESHPGGRRVLIEIPHFHSFRERLSFCLHSENASLVEYALVHLPRVVAQDKKLLPLFQAVTPILRSPSHVLEWLAARAIGKACQMWPRVVAAQSFTAVLERVIQCPAIEYVEILEALIPHLTEATLDTCVVPLVSKFVGCGSSYEFALGELLSNVSMATLRVGPEMFTRFLASEVIVDNYFPKLLVDAVRCGVVNEDWITRTYSEALVLAAVGKPEFRKGAMRTVVCFAELFPQKVLCRYVATGLQWAEKDDSIGLILLSRADEIVTPKTSDELFQPVFDLLVRITRNGDVESRSSIPKLMVENPSIFSGMTSSVHNVIMGFGRDPAPEVRMAFVDNFMGLFAGNKGLGFQESLFAVIMELFSDPSVAVRTRLCSSILFLAIGQTRLMRAAPAFTECMGTITRWRDFRDAVSTYVLFPPAVIKASWHDTARVVFSAVEQSCQALTNICYKFCSRVVSVLEPDLANSFVDGLVTTFAKSEKYNMRQLFPKLACACVTRTQEMNLVDKVSAEVEALATDPVASVVAAVIASILHIRNYYQAHSHPKEKALLSLFMGFSECTDPYIQDVWTEHWRMLNASLRSLPTIEQGGMEQSKSCVLTMCDIRIPKAVPSFASETMGASPGVLHSVGYRKARVRMFRKTHGVPLTSSTFSLSMKRDHM